MLKLYIQHEGRVINTDKKFTHVMAIALDPRTQYRDGVIRCITSREGDVTVKGYVDRSELYRVQGNSLEHFEISNRLKIKNEKEIIDNLVVDGRDFIGLEIEIFG